MSARIGARTTTRDNHQHAHSRGSHEDTDLCAHGGRGLVRLLGPLVARGRIPRCPRDRSPICCDHPGYADCDSQWLSESLPEDAGANDDEARLSAHLFATATRH